MTLTDKRLAKQAGLKTDDDSPIEANRVILVTTIITEWPPGDAPE
jgi:hypothetical protein